MSTALSAAESTPAPRPTGSEGADQPVVLPRTSAKPRWGVVAVYLLGLLLAWGVFVLRSPSGAQTSFRFSSAGAFFDLPDLTLPTLPTAIGLAVLFTAVTAWAVLRRGHLPAWAHVLGGLAFIATTLVWAAAGTGSVVPVVSLLAGALALSVPLIFGAMSGILCERSGIINIAIEGQLLFGAFAAAVVASLAANAWLGLLAAPVAGALVGALLVLFAVVFRVDQIIVGVVLNTLVLGLTGFLFSSLLTQDRELWNSRQALPQLPVPVLSKIPVIGPVLFDQTILVYLMYVVVAVLHVMLFRSTWGLRTRAVGEHPKAADTVGVDVNRLRVVNTLIGGAVAGLGGAFFTIGAGLAFGRDMSAGNGFIALAAMILGRWSPKGAVVAALLFGFTKNLGNVLSSIGSPLPTDLLLMLPYLVTIVAVAGLVGRVRPPAAEGTPYVKGQA
ncbi:ABC transporter permease [Kytococcus schroeteri]|uniref:ABC transporter permease n=1 Tax=Kytococcus schroeteri TaxID=138300 RepID=A0A2I1P917_9MICO|nr:MULTISPECIES: ABC transporter permease [Kytococcus]OFS15354.1 ABC transporter permease [Kytococcus sp. HMSC28H12]PKZ41110.1 ABC transporter permease [Kytococcus schroeteri]